MIIEELWIDITELNGDYQISNLGRIRRATPCIGSGQHKTYVGKIIKTEIDEHGYERLILRRNKKRYRFRIHTLVASAFIPNPLNKKYVHHVDHNKTNKVDNLQWCTVIENNDSNLTSYTIFDILNMLHPTKPYVKEELIQFVNSLECHLHTNGLHPTGV